MKKSPKINSSSGSNTLAINTGSHWISIKDVSIEEIPTETKLEIYTEIAKDLTQLLKYNWIIEIEEHDNQQKLSITSTHHSRDGFRINISNCGTKLILEEKTYSLPIIQIANFEIADPEITKNIMNRIIKEQINYYKHEIKNLKEETTKLTKFQRKLSS